MIVFPPFKSFTLTLVSIVILSTISCDNKHLTPVDMTKFIGTWELKGRTMFDGIYIQIDKNKKNEYVGVIKKLNENKWVNQFSEIGEQWVLKIERMSNFQFELSEKRIASELFGLYDLKTTDTYKVEFIDDNTLVLAKGSQSPLKSKIKYIKVQ